MVKRMKAYIMENKEQRTDMIVWKCCLLLLDSRISPEFLAICCYTSEIAATPKLQHDQAVEFIPRLILNSDSRCTWADVTSDFHPQVHTYNIGRWNCFSYRATYNLSTKCWKILFESERYAKRKFWHNFYNETWFVSLGIWGIKVNIYSILSNQKYFMHIVTFLNDPVFQYPMAL